MIRSGGSRTRPFPIDIQQAPAGQHLESPVFFGSPLNSPIDFHAQKDRHNITQGMDELTKKKDRAECSKVCGI
jgi:hypothetical protein